MGIYFREDGYRCRRDQIGRGDDAGQTLNWKSATAAAARIQVQAPDALEVLFTPGASLRKLENCPTRARVLNSCFVLTTGDGGSRRGEARPAVGQRGAPHRVPRIHRRH